MAVDGGIGVAERRFAVLPPYQERGVLPPRRQTATAAGYDLAAAERVEVPAGGVAMVPTGVCVHMPADEYLVIHVRSSLGLRSQLVLANGTGVIDADYVENADNGGHIFIPLRNLGAAPVVIAAGERIAQGIFQRYLITDDDTPGGTRSGGFGSTGRA